MLRSELIGSSLLTVEDKVDLVDACVLETGIDFDSLFGSLDFFE